MKNYLLLLVLFFGISSCIPTKDLIYFQGKPTEKNTVRQLNNTPYKLQVNDIIDIQIKATDETLVALFKNVEKSNINQITPQQLYFSSYSVDKNGLIRIPYLGEINVLGYSVKETRLKIESELAKMFKNMDDIFVTVKLAGIRFTIIGEINKPGTNVLFQNKVTIIEAIADAGDIKMTGDRRNVKLIRKNLDGTQKFNLDLTGYDFLDSEAYIIQPNDIIYIEPLKQKSWGTGDTGAKTMTTIISTLSLITTTILLIKNL